MSRENKNLQDWVRIYYVEQGYNCSETIIHAGNSCYELGLHEEDMKMMACYGSGMYSGGTCGALISATAVLSKLMIRTKAHDQLAEIRPVIQTNYRNFEMLLGGIDCRTLRPLHHTKEQKCLKTVLLAAQALEKTVQEYRLYESNGQEQES